MKEINRTASIEITKRIRDRTTEYSFGNTIYVVNSFFSMNTKTTAKDIIERLAVREINKITA